jgi:hypothetical protein
VADEYHGSSKNRSADSADVERGEQLGVLCRVRPDLRQRAFQIGKALLCRHVGSAKPLPAPFGVEAIACALKSTQRCVISSEYLFPYRYRPRRARE